MFAADFRPPAGEQYATIGKLGSILPGGRIVKPLGVQIETGPGTFGLAVSPKGTVATTDIGYESLGITVIESRKEGWEQRHQWARTPHLQAAERSEPDWKGVFLGIAFETERSVWISEGNSGRLRLVDTTTGNHQKIVSLNQGEWKNSFTGDLAYDAAKRLIYVIDQANFRIAAVDARKGQVLASVRVGRMPFAIALSFVFLLSAMGVLTAIIALGPRRD